MTKKSTYYVTNNNGLFELRKTRFKGRKKEHPHDVCAVARSRAEINSMRKKFNLY
jgi:hypothetical protein